MLSYSDGKYIPRVPLIILTVEKNEREKFDFVLLSFLLIPNKYSTIRDVPFLGLSCMRAKIGKLWLQARITVSFQ